MSRLGYIARNPKRSLGALATVAVAASLTAGSGAYFADESASEGNSIEAGTVAITTFGSADPVVDGNNCRSTSDAFVEPAGYNALAECDNTGISETEKSATFTVSNLVPTGSGHEIKRRFQVKNDGDVPAALRLTVKNLSAAGNEGLANAVRLDVTRLPNAAAGNSTYQNVVSNIAFPTINNINDVPADGQNNVANSSSPRIALEPGQTYTYELRIRLPESGANQSSLMGQTIKFDVNVLAKSINSTQS